MEAELNEVLDIARQAATKFKAGIVLTGILPTIQVSDLTAENLTPNPRYHEIDRVVTILHGDNRIVQIKGLDELQLTLPEHLYRVLQYQLSDPPAGRGKRFCEL